MGEIHTITVTATQITTIFGDRWVMIHRIPSYLLSDIKPQFRENVASTMNNFPTLEVVGEDSKSSQTIGNSEGYCLGVLMRVYHYVTESLYGWRLL